MDKQKIQTKIIFTVISLMVSAGIFTYLFKFISIGQVVQIIKSVDRGALMMFVTLSLGMSFFRTWRYGIILRLSGYKPGKTSLFLVVLVRNFFADLLPARIGTVVYIFMVNTRLGIPLGPATSSFALAFLFDILAMAPLIFLASLWAAFSAKTYMLPLFLGALVIGGITVACIHFLPSLCRWGVLVFEEIKLLKRPFFHKLSDILISVRSEVLKTKQAKLYTPVMILSLLVRVTKYASLYVFLYALLRALGYSWSDLSIPTVFIGITVSEFAASLPISGIASFGVYEGTWAIVFELLGFPGNIAKLTAVSHHLFTQVYGYLLGALALILLVLPIYKKRSDYSSKKFRTESKVSFYRKILACLIGMIALLYGYSHINPVNSKSSSWKSRAEADVPSSDEINKRKALMDQFPGRILFDSNRSGTFGIYTIQADGSGLMRISDEPKWHEMFPDPSPSGEQIVYAKAKSLNRMAPSEIWLVDRDGKNPRKIINDGNFPTFSKDGKRIYFERKRKKVMVYTIATGSEKEIFPANNFKFKKYQIVKPRVSSNDKIVAFTSDAPKRWNAWYANIQNGKAIRIQRGCEPTFFDQGYKIAFISNVKVKERTGIFSLNISNGSIQAIEDADVPRGHEYFPTIAYGDRYLLYSACRPEEHSHETGNYQIFVKNVQNDRRIRITFDRFTNRWPKLLLAS